MESKVAVVTGGSSGMGFAIAEKLASYGYTLALIARGEKELKRTVQALKKKFQVNINWYICDVTRGEDVKMAIKSIKKDFGKIDVLVNNAGGSFFTLKDDEFDEAFQQNILLNLTSTHLCCRLFSTIMKNGGSIVNISSLNGETIFWPLLEKSSTKMGYVAAKAGAIQITKAYAIELSARKIRVNAVAPGAIYPTGMTSDWNASKKKMVIDNTPLGRLGKPTDVANAVYFLVSDLSSFITGHTLDVNGGRYMK